MYLKNIQCFIVRGTSFFTDTTAVPKVVNDVICPLCNLLICPQIAHLHVCSNSKQQHGAISITVLSHNQGVFRRLCQSVWEEYM